MSSGLIGADESVVAVLTGHLLKDPDVSRGSRENLPIEVDASLAAIERALSSGIS
jgi:threonine synthase